MKKTFFFAILLLASPLWEDGRVAAQTANEPGSGNALNFVGVNNYLLISNSPSLSVTEITFTCWVRIANTTGDYTLMSPEGTGSGQIVFEHQGSDKGLRIGHFGSGTDVNSYVYLNANQWYHLAFVYTHDTATIYVDGILLITGAVNTTGIIDGNYNIGRRQATATNTGYAGYLNGQLDEVRIWNRALTQTEIRDNMCKKLPDNYGNGLVGYWRFDEGIDNTCPGGQDACDASGNGNNGTGF